MCLLLRFICNINDIIVRYLDTYGLRYIYSPKCQEVRPACICFIFVVTQVLLLLAFYYILSRAFQISNYCNVSLNNTASSDRDLMVLNYFRLVNHMIEIG